MDKDNFEKIIRKKTMLKDTLAIHDVLWGKLQYFPHIIKVYYKVKF
jgi:hypothetical protein